MDKYLKNASLSIKALSTTDRAWLAGFIDGEGFIGITKQKKHSTKNQAEGYLYHPYVIITGTEKDAIYFIKELTGCGKIVSLSRTTGHKVAYQYKLSKYKDLQFVLNQLHNYLRIKKMQSQLVLEYIFLRDQASIKTGRNSRGSTSFTEREEQLYQELRTINKRGT